MTPSRFCQQCLEPLPRATDNRVVCPSCGATYPDGDGILHTACDTDFRYFEVPDEVMDEALERGSRGDWHGLMSSGNPWFEGFVPESHFSPTRCAWKILMRLPDNRTGTRALDFGCGWGVNAIGLSEHFEEVVGVELSRDRLLNMVHLGRHLGLDNLTAICGGDGDRLPFPDDWFDLICLNGVIEWIPLGSAGNPRQCQVRFLKEIHRILKPGGEVYLASENRSDYTYLMGRREDHTGLLFGSLLPRPVADLYSRLVRGQPYRNYTYTPGGYRSLLSESGLTSNQQFGVTPAHRLFFRLFPLTTGRVLDHEESRGNPLKSALLRSSVAVNRVSVIGNRASDRDLGPSFIEEIAATVAKATGHELTALPRTIHTTNFSAKCVWDRTDGSTALVRIPLCQEKSAWHDNAVAAQTTWVSNPATGQFVPRVERIEFRGLTVTLESFVRTDPRGPLPSFESFAGIQVFLTELATATGRPLRDAWVESLDDFSRALDSTERNVIDRLTRHPVMDYPTCWGHGDFHSGNLLWNRNGLQVVIDWDWAGREHPPLEDLFQLAGRLTENGARALARGSGPHIALDGLLDSLTKSTGIDPRHLQLLAEIHHIWRVRTEWRANAAWLPGVRFLQSSLRRRLHDSLTRVASLS